jgi:hypothetical protein
LFALVAKALKELRKKSNANGLSDECPHFLRYYTTDMKGMMEVEVGLMTNSGLAGQGRIQPGSLPKGRYASLVYRGSGLLTTRSVVHEGRVFQRSGIVSHAGDPASLNFS